MHDPRSATVLVIDDDPEMRAVLRDFLERDGHSVIEGASAADAIAAVESRMPDAVIVDKEMPGMSGMELLSVLRRWIPEVPVILITAFGGPAIAEEALSRGAWAYLEKPFRVTSAIDVVETALDRGRRA